MTYLRTKNSKISAIEYFRDIFGYCPVCDGRCPQRSGHCRPACDVSHALPFAISHLVRSGPSLRFSLSEALRSQLLLVLNFSVCSLLFHTAKYLIVVHTHALAHKRARKYQPIISSDLGRGPGTPAEAAQVTGACASLGETATVFNVRLLSEPSHKARDSKGPQVEAGSTLSVLSRR